MSKEVTEKYYKGTLPSGHYYFSNGKSVYPVEHRQIEPCLCANGITVVDKVPDYDEYKQMEEQINNLQKMLEYECSKRCELEAQLAEANEVIRFYANTDGLTEEEKQMSSEKYHLVYGLKANDYLKKHGVEK